MKNHFFGATRLQRRKYSSVFTTALLDRDIDPMEVFSDEEHAKRRQLGDIAFGVELDRQGNRSDKLYLVPEICQSSYYDPHNVMSLNLISLAESDFGRMYEITNSDEDFQLLSWEDGMIILNGIADESVKVANSKIVTLLNRIDAFGSQNRSLDKLRTEVGPATGYRNEVSM